MTATRAVGLLLAAGVSLLATACGGEEGSGEAARTPDGAQGEAPVPVGSAVDSIVQARCDREARCNNVGLLILVLLGAGAALISRRMWMRSRLPVAAGALLVVGTLAFFGFLSFWGEY